MTRLFKYFGSILALVIIVALMGVYVWNCDNGSKGKEKVQKQNPPEETSKQYKMSFNFDGDKSQIIDLIKGKAEFNIVYSGTSTFTAKILNTDGSLLALLADVVGPYNQKRIVEVPETGTYLLDVKTSGEWSLFRQ
jgi:hypothetical protein